MTDSITVDDRPAAEYYNTFEKVRDPSHHCVHSLDTLEKLPTSAGFEIEATRRLSKEVKFEKWADRQRVSRRGKSNLLNLICQASDALRSMLESRWVDGILHFTLWKAVILARPS